MRTFKQTREIFELAKAFHGQVADFYDRLHDQSHRRRVRFLLEYLARHQRVIQDVVLRYEAHASEGVLQSWYQYVPEHGPLLHLDHLSIKADMTVEQVVELAMEVDEALIGFYSDLAENAESPEVREVFEAFLCMERHDEFKLRETASQT